MIDRGWYDWGHVKYRSCDDRKGGQLVTYLVVACFQVAGEGFVLPSNSSSEISPRSVAVPQQQLPSEPL